MLDIPRPTRELVVPWVVWSGVLGLFCKFVYRNFVVHAGIHDLGLANVAPNLLWSAFLSFLFACRQSPRAACVTSRGQLDVRAGSIERPRVRGSNSFFVGTDI